MLGLLLLLLNLELGVVHHFLSLSLSGHTSLLDDLSLHFVGVAEDLSLLATGVINKRFSFGTGVVKLFFSLLSIFHTLIDEIGTIVDPLEDGGPGELPQEEEEHAKSDEHPEYQTEVGSEQFHLISLEGIRGRGR